MYQKSGFLSQQLVLVVDSCCEKKIVSLLFKTFSQWVVICCDKFSWFVYTWYKNGCLIYTPRCDMCAKSKLSTLILIFVCCHQLLGANNTSRGDKCTKSFSSSKNFIFINFFQLLQFFNSGWQLITFVLKIHIAVGF